MSKIVRICSVVLVFIFITSCAAMVTGNIDFSKIPHKSAYPQKPIISQTAVYYIPGMQHPEEPKRNTSEQPPTQNITEEGGQEETNLPSDTTEPKDDINKSETITKGEKSANGETVGASETDKTPSEEIQPLPPDEALQTQNRVISVFFLPLKDSTVKTSLISSRIRSIFALDQPDILIITGIDKNEGEKLASLFADYTPYFEKDAVILCDKELDTTLPTVGMNTLITTYVSDDAISLSSLKNPTSPHIPSPDIETIKEYANTEIPSILALSPAERASSDFSAWSDIPRKTADEYWSIISTLENYDFYDAVENSRYNSSSSGPLYSDWTYKKGNDELRLDFLMLRGVGVVDVFTMDIADISTDKDISRRGIFAHIVIEDKKDN